MDVINDVGAAKAVSASDTPRTVTVDVITPFRFDAYFRHVLRDRLVLSAGVALSSTSLSLSVELMCGTTKGLGIGIGPVWLFLAMTPVKP